MRSYNAADEAQVKKRAQKVKDYRALELDDIKAILDIPAGVRFFKRLLAEGKIFQTTFTGNSNTFFLEGHRNLALKFFTDVAEAAPDKVAELMIRKETDEDI